MVGAGRLELPTSTSRTWRANQAALLPDIMIIAQVPVVSNEKVFCGSAMIYIATNI